MRKWEYVVHICDFDDHREMTRNLDEWGREGWELVSVTGDRFPTLYLKRPIPEFDPTCPGGEDEMGTPVEAQ
jgi:hypothetical protein